MRIFIYLPTWLGDAVMSSAALYALKEHYPQASFVFYGSKIACELFKEFPHSSTIIASKHRFFQALKLRQTLGKFDLAFSLRSAFSSKIILKLIKAKQKFIFDKKQNKKAHQVLKYLYFLENALNFKACSQNLKLPFEVKHSTSKTLGLNPGAKYGSAKRWNSQYFARVALEFKDYEILIFGIASEAKICDEIEQILSSQGLKIQNLCGKTTIKELCEKIASLSLFISNDSGAMHLGAVYKTPTIALFGPTNFTQTSPWANENARILHLDLACMPCMKRICPLKHHQCMQDLKPEFVIQAAKELLKSLENEALSLKT